ncbi:MAG TPA: N-acetylmuramoyl-L-alanine amidase [Bacteroidales bacterium]|nr:N-acetylmuramoyl-L-alanine amidase [Bacteroidales bacterium]
MDTCYKNGKQTSKYINRFFLAVIAFLPVFLSSSVADRPVREKWVIVIDPGHGGRDPGAIGSHSYEKNVTLPVALKTGEYLEHNLKNVKIIYTRTTDEFVELAERAQIANRNKADLFISIHANSHPQKSTYGSETWVMGHHKDQQNLEVAMKENSVILLEKDYSTRYEGFDPKSPESYIMFTLMQSAYSEQSIDLASKIQLQYKNQIGRYDRGVKQAGFWVLYMTTMPSVLTEIGFISNEAEEKYINSKQGQENIAQSIYRAVSDYIADIDRKSAMPSILTDTVPEKPVSLNDSSLKGKTLYTVQVAASVKKIVMKPENFRNLSSISEIMSGNRYRYTSGIFEIYDSAVVYRKKIESIYPDAFVVSVRNSKIVPLQEALDRRRKK